MAAKKPAAKAGTKKTVKAKTTAKTVKTQKTKATAKTKPTVKAKKIVATTKTSQPKRKLVTTASTDPNFRATMGLPSASTPTTPRFDVPPVTGQTASEPPVASSPPIPTPEELSAPLAGKTIRDRGPDESEADYHAFLAGLGPDDLPTPSMPMSSRPITSGSVSGSGEPQILDSLGPSSGRPDPYAEPKPAPPAPLAEATGQEADLADKDA